MRSYWIPKSPLVMLLKLISGLFRMNYLMHLAFILKCWNKSSCIKFTHSCNLPSPLERSQVCPNCFLKKHMKTSCSWLETDLCTLLPPLVITPPAGPFVCTLLLCIFSLLCPLPFLFSHGQISLAPWGQMRRPSWLMCRVTTTHSQASRRWEMIWKISKQ